MYVAASIFVSLKRRLFSEKGFFEMIQPSSSESVQRSEMRTRARAPAWVSGLLVSLVTILICLGGVELIGYYWEQTTAQSPLGWTLVAARRLHLEKHGATNRAYYLFRPNEDYLWGGIPVHINSRGFRSEEFDLPKPSNTYRILNLGDSIAFGWAIGQSDTYGKQLEQMLNARKGAMKYEVINAGIPGWNLVSEYNFLSQDGINYQPDAVILDLTLVNDVYGSGASVEDQPVLFQWLRDNTYGWPFLTIQARFILAQSRGPEAIPVLNPPRNAEAYFPLNENDPVWDRMWKIISDIKTLCQSRNIPLIIIAFPTALQVNRVDHPNIPQRVLARRARAQEIFFLDLLPAYQQWCANNEMDACEGYQNELFADVWMHPTPIGHLIATDQLLPLFLK